MRGVIFDIESKYAHFRKVYTNSSSLTYSVPPRTTLEGIIAAILGYERDTYYKMLDSSSVNIAVKKNCPTYTMTHTLNYIKAVSPGELVKPKKHTQIPVEILAAEANVSYRVYVAGDSFEDLETLIRRIKHEKYVFPPTMGTAFFLADISFVAEADFKRYFTDETVPIATVINTELVDKLDLGIAMDSRHEMSLYKEKMPKDFGEGRILQPAVSYFVETSGKPIYAKLKEGVSCWKVSYGKMEEVIVFL
jgi:CRISPR-associated protein Cas5h